MCRKCEFYLNTETLAPVPCHCWQLWPTHYALLPTILTRLCFPHLRSWHRSPCPHCSLRGTFLCIVDTGSEEEGEWDVSHTPRGNMHRRDIFLQTTKYTLIWQHFSCWRCLNVNERQNIKANITVFHVKNMTNMLSIKTRIMSFHFLLMIKWLEMLVSSAHFGHFAECSHWCWEGWPNGSL